jgi:hypothetical protein
MKTTHTPMPWNIGISYIDGDIAIREDNGAGECVAVVCDCYEDQAANAAFIVRACNSHDAILTALEACQFAIRFGLEKELKPYNGAWGKLLNDVNAAIAKAKGEA